MDEIRLKLLEGHIGLPGIGAVQQSREGLLPYAVVDEAGREIEVFSVFLRDLVLTDMSPLTVRSYGNDLLRWWRVLQLIGIPWDKAGRLEVEVMVGWMRSAVNPQRRGSGARVMNPQTGKRPLAAGYAPATINHALAVLASFYAFHARFGRGPVANPVPERELWTSGAAGTPQSVGGDARAAASCAAEAEGGRADAAVDSG